MIQMINVFKLIAVALHCYLTQLVVSEYLTPVDGVSYSWITAALMAGGSLLSGRSNRRAAKKANRRNRRQAEADRRMQYQMFKEGNTLFGQAGMSDPSLNYFELSGRSDDDLLKLAQQYDIDANYKTETYRTKKGGLSGMFGGTKKKTRTVLDRESIINQLQSKAGTPDREMLQGQLDSYRQAQELASPEAYQDINEMYQPMVDQSREVAQGVFDDSLTDRRISFYDPVFQARQGVVDTQKQAQEEALQDTLGTLEAKQRKRGFSGDSLANLAIEGRARKDSATKIGKLQKLMELQNASDVLTQQMKGQELKINNLGLPGQQAAREAQMRMLPVSAATDAALEAQKPLQFFKTKQGTPQLSSLPKYQQLPTNTELFTKAASGFLGNMQQQAAQDDYMQNMKDIASIQASAGRPVAGPSASDPNFRFFNYGQQQKPTIPQGFYNRQG